MRDIKLVVCDLVGTTVRDRGEVVAAFNEVLRQNGIEVTSAQLNKVRGSSKRQAIYDLLPAGPERSELAAATYTAFCSRLSAYYQAEGAEEIPGAAQVFSWLRENEVRIALNTGFERDLTNLLLTALGWNSQSIDATVCGDEVARGRPAPDLILRAMELTGVTSVAHVANVGDTVLDLQAGRNAGVSLNLGVLSGAHDRATLEREAPSHLISSISDLPQILESH